VRLRPLPHHFLQQQAILFDGFSRYRTDGLIILFVRRFAQLVAIIVAPASDMLLEKGALPLPQLIDDAPSLPFRGVGLFVTQKCHESQFHAQMVLRTLAFGRHVITGLKIELLDNHGNLARQAVYVEGFIWRRRPVALLQTMNNNEQ